MKENVRKKRRKGSSSILIIMIIITLVLFGILSVMSAYSSYKLSEKSAFYINMNYELESEAGEAKAKWIEMMRRSAAEAVAYRTRNVQADNRMIYWQNFKQRLQDRPKNVIECTIEEDAVKQILRIKAMVARNYSSGEEKFGFGMEFLYPDAPIESVEDVQYKISSWKKILKDMEYTDVIEFENIEIEGETSEEVETP